MTQINRLRTLCAASMCASLAMLSVPVTAQSGSWPNKPVTLMVAYPPGGVTDITTRLLAKELSSAFGQPFIVENKAGAAGQVATEYVAKRPADGYMLLVAATGYVVAPVTRPKVNYDPLKDLIPLSILVQMPNMIVVNPSVRANTVAEFLAWAKTQPSIPYGTPGAGGSTHLGGELLRKVTGLPFTHVAYRGAAAAVQDTVAGQIPMSIQDSVTVAPYIASGHLRPIAVMSAERSAVFPSLPTLKESGFKDFDVYSWLGLFAPAGTPPDIAQKINVAINKILHTPEMKESLRKQSSEPMRAMSLDEARKFIESELVRWRELVRVTGVKFEE